MVNPIHGLLLRRFEGQKAGRIKVVFRRVADKYGVVVFAVVCRWFAVNELLLCEKDRQAGAAADFAVRRVQQSSADAESRVTTRTLGNVKRHVRANQSGQLVWCCADK